MELFASIYFTTSRSACMHLPYGECDRLDSDGKRLAFSWEAVSRLGGFVLYCS